MKHDGWARIIEVTAAERLRDMGAKRLLHPVDVHRDVRGSHTLCVVPATSAEQELRYAIRGVWNRRPWN